MPYAESELIARPGKLVRKGLWLVVPDGWIGGEVKLELDIAPVSATQPHRYTVHRTLALDHGAERMPTGQHLLARVKGLPASEQRGKARSQRAGQRRGSRERRAMSHKASCYTRRPSPLWPTAVEGTSAEEVAC